MQRIVFLLLLLGIPCLLGCGAHRSAGDSRPAPDEINTSKASAHSLIEAGDYEGAIRLLLPLSEKNVRDSQLHTMLAEAYWKLGGYTEAVTHFESALRLDHTDAETHLNFAVMLIEMGKVGRALTESELAIRFDENSALAHYNHGLALYQLGRKDDAVSHWNRAFTLEAENPRYAAALGMGLSGKDDAQAGKYFERAAALGADGPTFHNNYGLLLQRVGEYELAEPHFEQAVMIDPANESYRRNLAVLQMTMGSYAAAVPQWTTLLETDPDSRTYRVYLAQAYLEGERFSDAIALLEDWLPAQENVRRPRGYGTGSREPGLDEAYDVLGMSFRGAGELGKAQDAMAEALLLSPDNVTHLNNYGVILAENGRIEEARTQWEKVLRLEPENAVARQNLSAVKQ